MRCTVAKYIRRLVNEGLAEMSKELPDKRWVVRKFKTVEGYERFQLMVHPECVRYRIKHLKKFVKDLNQTPEPKPVKNVGFGSRRKRRGQAIRASIPKFSRDGELLHNV